MFWNLKFILCFNLFEFVSKLVKLFINLLRNINLINYFLTNNGYHSFVEFRNMHKLMMMMMLSILVMIVMIFVIYRCVELYRAVSVRAPG